MHGGLDNENEIQKQMTQKKEKRQKKQNMSPEWDGISKPILHLHPPPGTKIALDRHLRMWKGKYSVRQACRPSHSGAYSYKNDTHCKCAQTLKRRKNGNRSFSVVSNYWISHFFSFLLFVFSVLRCNHTIILHIWGIMPISSFILAPSRFFSLSECGHVGVGAFDVLCWFLRLLLSIICLYSHLENEVTSIIAI